MLYFSKKPAWVMRFYGDCTWRINTDKKIIYLTFDDGPEPGVTEYVLETLDKFHAKGTFFCIGKQVEKYPQLYENLLTHEHCVGNHTYSHLDGWKTNNTIYYRDIAEASSFIPSPWFRPPYGHILPWQVSRLKRDPYNLHTVLWSVLSGDFDQQTSREKCLQNVLSNTRPGSIILFHDTALAYPNLKYTLPRVLNHFAEQGFCFRTIEDINY